MALGSLLAAVTIEGTDVEDIRNRMPDDFRCGGQMIGGMDQELGNTRANFRRRKIVGTKMQCDQKRIVMHPVGEMKPYVPRGFVGKTIAEGCCNRRDDLLINPRGDQNCGIFSHGLMENPRCLGL